MMLSVDSYNCQPELSNPFSGSLFPIFHPMAPNMAKATKKNKIEEISLEQVMMNCRNALRGKVGGNEKNRDTVMGLVFLKFVGDKFAARRAEIMAQYPAAKTYFTCPSIRAGSIWWKTPLLTILP